MYIYLLVIIYFTCFMKIRPKLLKLYLSYLKIRGTQVQDSLDATDRRFPVCSSTFSWNCLFNEGCLTVTVILHHLLGVLEVPGLQAALLGGVSLNYTFHKAVVIVGGNQHFVSVQPCHGIYLFMWV